jgi:tetratricopeptide (TPR) repeat protein
VTIDDPAGAVRYFLRAQNLEQLGRVDEAIELYEATVRAEFDSSGPYDRLIAIYAGRAMHSDVVRVAEAALAHVRTHEGKQSWYEVMRAEALKAQRNVPQAAPKRDQA